MKKNKLSKKKMNRIPDPRKLIGRKPAALAKYEPEDYRHRLRVIQVRRSYAKLMLDVDIWLAQATPEFISFTQESPKKSVWFHITNFLKQLLP